MGGEEVRDHALFSHQPVILFSIPRNGDESVGMAWLPDGSGMVAVVQSHACGDCATGSLPDIYEYTPSAAA